MSEENVLPFSDWSQQISERHPQFLYWNKTLQLELLFLQFLRSIREGNFQLYVKTLGKIIPWMFVLDHYHYARWLTVQVRDLVQLETVYPSAFLEFNQGHFVTQKSHHTFSLLAHDHVHEQLNAMVKGEGGAIGITENERALRRWMVAGPEISRLLNEYDGKYNSRKEDSRHHEQIPSIQKAFAADVKNLVAAMDNVGNPFVEESADFFSLDKKVIMSDEVINTIKTIEDMGNTQYQRFVEERITDTVTPFKNTIAKNNVPLFKSSTKGTSKTKTQVTNMKTDVQLFSRMYISCQSRDGNLDNLFDHENHAWPPSLSDNNRMHHGNKSDLLGCLESLAPPPREPPKAQVLIIDGAALVHTLDPKHCNVIIKTFSDYAQHGFIPYIKRELQKVNRVDVVWDVYKVDSLKSQERQSRGGGESLRVGGNTTIPVNWMNFLRVDKNETELFRFLANVLKSTEILPGKSILSTDGVNVITASSTDVSSIQPCTHEEADYRMMLHVSHAYQEGHRKFILRATDTDVLVLAGAIASAMDGCEIWIAFGHGNNFRYIAAHTIAHTLGSDRSWGLLFFHAVSGCDTVSSFHGVGKKTAWDVWRSMQHLAPIFSRPSHTPECVSESDIDELERYVVVLYSRTSALSKVNEARKHLFAYGNRNLENILPTRAALEQHIKRAAYQAGHIWGQALVADPCVPSPVEWGWTKDTDECWTPLWTVLPEASEACRELIKCQCKKNCSGRCKCSKANLKCTQLCFCGGQCGTE